MNLFKKDELKLLWPFYLDALISPMLFFMPAFGVIYFMSIGFSIFQISVLTSILLLFILLLEIPTGAIADLYGRKFSVQAGAVIEGLAIISIFFTQNYYILLFIFAIRGIAMTLNSGAKEAWVTDLINKNKKDSLHDYFVKSRVLYSTGLVISGLLGVFLVKSFGLQVIWIVAGASYFVSFFILNFAKENFTKRKIRIKDSFKELKLQSKTSINYTKNHPILFLFLMASSLVMFASAFAGDLSWIKFLKELNFPDYAFGYMWSLMGITGILAPIVSLKLLKKGKERNFIVITLILGMLILSLVFFAKTYIFAIGILLSYMFTINLSAPAERTYFHKFIKNKLRATIGSIESMLISIVIIIALPLAGLSIDHFGARFTILLAPILMIPSVIIYLMIREK